MADNEEIGDEILVPNTVATMLASAMMESTEMLARNLGYGVVEMTVTLALDSDEEENAALVVGATDRETQLSVMKSAHRLLAQAIRRLESENN